MIPPCPTYQSNKPRRTNQKPRSWANGIFRIEGFAGKRSLLSPPPPPFLVLFVVAPFSARPECETPSRGFSRPDISFGSYGNACYEGNIYPVRVWLLSSPSLTSREVNIAGSCRMKFLFIRKSSLQVQDI